MCPIRSCGLGTVLSWDGWAGGLPAVGAGLVGVYEDMMVLWQLVRRYMYMLEPPDISRVDCVL